MTLRTRIAVASSALSVLVVAGVVHAQFSPPTCVPPNCSPEVIQNIDISSAAQSASINITGSGKLGGTFQTGALAPVLTLATDNLMYGNVGGTSTNGALILLQFGSVDRLRVTLAGQMQLPLGSVGAPSYSFSGDTNTGFYSSAADSVSFVTNGVSRTTINNNGTTVNSGVLSVPTGSAAAPSITFTGDTNTGIFRGSADNMSFVTNGVTGMTITSTNSVAIPGALTVNGTFTSSGGLSGNGSGLTNLNASNITTGTLADARLSTNVPLLNGTQTFTGANTFSNAGNSFTGNGAGLTSLNATNITSGALPDARLSSNVALYNANGTFTGNNGFTGMTSLGSAVLVTGAGQNLVYGVHDTTSTGNLMLLQTESAGVYTDRFRIDSDGDVTATSFTGVGTGLTALNATNLTSGIVPSARISGTYSNALTFSGANSYTNRSTFGSATLVVAAGQNLLYGNMDTTSAGNLLLLQNESVDRFRVDAAGNVTAAGSLTVTGSITAGGSALCQQNGTNCPPMVGGSGTTNYVSKFTSASTLGDSAIYDDGGGNVGIGTASPSATLSVSGSISASNLSTYMVAAGAAGVTGQVVGVGSYGVVGSGGSYGVYGSSGGRGVYGYNTSAGGSGAGVEGYHSGTGPGVQGSSASGWGGSFSSLYVTPGTAYFASGVTLNGGATLGANTILTLGTGASDPAGANGAMFYNTTSNTFRCYVSGAWGGCGVGGSGTTNYLAKFTGTSTLGNSLFRDDGSSTAIGGTPAAGALTVIGPTNQNNALTATTNANNGVGIYGFGMGTSSIGVYGQGQGSGVSGVAGGAGGVGLQGTGSYAGVTGTTANVWGYGVQGSVPAGSYVYGVYGITPSSQYSSAGVAGINSGNGMGGYFQSNNATTYALLAYNGGNPTTGYAFQAQGTSSFTGTVTMNTVLGVGTLLNVSGNTILGDAAADSLTINGSTVVLGNNLNFDANTFYIDATNNRIGLGTNSPQRQLTVYHATDAVAQLTNGTAGANTGDGLLLIQSGMNAYVENGEVGNLTLRTSAADRVIIDSSGNVGVGYAPSYKLDVAGRGFFDGEIAVGGDISSVWTGYGVASSGTASGGHFYNTNYPSVYGSNGYAYSGDRYGVYGSAIDSTGTVKYAGYFIAGGSGTNYGVYSSGSTYGVYANGTSYGLRAAGSTYGVYSTGTYAGYFGSSGGAYAYMGYNTSYGVYAYAPGSGYGAYLDGGYYGVYAQGDVRGGDFYDTTGGAHTFIAGGSYGVEILSGGAIKPSGTTWSNPSDARLKKDISVFNDGLQVARQLTPKNFTFNGLGGTEDGLKSAGFIAQEVMDIVPYMIDKKNVLLHPDDTEETEIYILDQSELPLILLNSVKELDLKIVGLEAKIEKIDAIDAKVRDLEERVRALEEELEGLKQ